MTSFKTFLLGSPLAGVLLIAGCGGGGGDAAVAPATPQPSLKTTACSNISMEYPLCGDPLALVPPKLQVSVPSTYAPGSNELAFFTALNVLRTSMGLGPLIHSPLLDLSAKTHTTYLDLNWVAGDNFHFEVAGRPGFTGVAPQDRIIAAGFPATLGTEVGAPAVGTFALQMLADTVFHRKTLMIEGLTHVGIFTSSTGGTTVNYAYAEPQTNSTHFLGVYPVDGQTDVPLTHYLESPNPFPELEMTVENMCKKTGFPISLQSSAKTRLNVAAFTLREVGQPVTLPVRLFEDGNGITLNSAFIVAYETLKPLTQYEVQFTGAAQAFGTREYLKIDKTWRFATGARSLLFCN